MTDILVVDDEPDIRSLIGDILEDEGHGVRLAWDSDTALAAIDAAPPDLVILDWMLPGPSGIVLAERIRRIPVYPAAEGYSLGGDIALLASNESPYPPLPAIQDAVTRVLGGLNRYPDPTCSALRKALSDRYEVPVHRIAIGNGSIYVSTGAPVPGIGQVLRFNL